jgi:thioredoxin reductase (NADPH)
MSVPEPRVAVVGAGPIGLEVAWALKRAGIDYVQFDKGQIASTIAWFPENMTFFSSTDRIAIAGVPIQVPGQRKCTKEEYLAYLRTVVQTHDLDVRTYEEVEDIAREGEGFRLRTTRGEYRVREVVLAVGDMARPRRLGVPGEELPHVHHRFVDPHPYFRKKLLVVGGKNSAVEAALRCWHAGADVALSYRRDAFDKRSVKYWLLPELLGRIRRGEIACHYETVPVGFRAGVATLRRGDEEFDVEADFVLCLVGFEPDQRLFEMAGVPRHGEGGAPVFDETTMETGAPGIYVAGTATAGAQQTYSVFIETCHVHAQRIVAALTGAPPPAAPPPPGPPES